MTFHIFKSEGLTEESEPCTMTRLSATKYHDLRKMVFVA